MNEVISNNGLMSRIQHSLDIYDRVLLIQENEEFRKCLEGGRKTDNGNFLLLMPDTVEDDFEEFGFTQQFLTQEEMEEISHMYYMYEFSNRFRIVSRENNYGSVFDLVDSGLLTYEEAFEAILR